MGYDPAKRTGERQLRKMSGAAKKADGQERYTTIDCKRKSLQRKGKSSKIKSKKSQEAQNVRVRRAPGGNFIQLPHTAHVSPADRPSP